MHDQTYGVNSHIKKEINIKQEYNINIIDNNPINKNLNINDDPDVDYVYVEDCDENNYVPT